MPATRLAVFAVCVFLSMFMKAQDTLSCDKPLVYFHYHGEERPVHYDCFTKTLSFPVQMHFLLKDTSGVVLHEGAGYEADLSAYCKGISTEYLRVEFYDSAKDKKGRHVLTKFIGKCILED